jgi:hypothetical protein
MAKKDGGFKKEFEASDSIIRLLDERGFDEHGEGRYLHHNLLSLLLSC